MIPIPNAQHATQRNAKQCNARRCRSKYSATARGASGVGGRRIKETEARVGQGSGDKTGRPGQVGTGQGQETVSYLMIRFKPDTRRGPE